MARIFIVEDNEDHLASIQTKVKRLGHEIVGTSMRAINALSKIKETSPEILLLDINLNGDNDGIILANQIKEFSNASTIYTTALTSDFVIKGAIASNPEAYLIKPINTEDIKATIDLILHKKKQVLTDQKKIVQNQLKNKYITVRTGRKLKKINFEDIKFLKPESRNYVSLTDIKNKNFTIRNSLKNLKKEVLSDDFTQIHRLYVININHINFINEKEQMLELEKNIYLPIGRTYKKELYQKLNLV